MRAAVYHGRLDVRVEDMPEPGTPGPNEVLLEVGLAAICGTDAAEFEHGPKFVPLERPHPASGHQGPMILGHEFAGRVLAVGSAVGDLEVGQRVVTGAGVWCGECAWCRAGRTNLCARYYTLGLHTHGGLAQYALAPAITCEVVPEACTDTAAAIAQPLAIALHARDRSGLRAGDSALVIGVGGIGSFVVAALADLQVDPLVAADLDETRLDTATLLGAGHTCLASEPDAVYESVMALTDGVGVDVAIEATGAAAALQQAIRSVRRGGRLLLIGQHYEPRQLNLFDLSLREVEVTTTLAHVCRTNLPAALEILATTKLSEHVLDTVVPLSGVVDEGLVVLAERRAKGKIVVDVSR
jgi:(R,R)-butanediol dehydrogenase/meso-butanediol dehydrogenase/diacetyl reductase